MRQPHPLLRLAAVASSILLLGAFVSYRAGAVNWFTGTAAGPEQSAAPEPPTPVKPETPPGGEKPPTLLPGSKSIAPLIPPPAPPAQQPVAP